MFPTYSGVDSEYASRSSSLGCRDTAGTSLGTAMWRLLRSSSVLRGSVPIADDCCWVEVALAVERWGLVRFTTISGFLPPFRMQVGHNLTNSATIRLGIHENIPRKAACVRSLPP